MATPPMVTVTGTIYEEDGDTLYNGDVTAVQPVTLRHADGTVVLSGRQIIPVVDGAFSASIAYCDHPDWSPDGSDPDTGWRHELIIPDGSLARRFTLFTSVNDTDVVNLGDIITAGFTPKLGEEYAPINHTHGDPGGGGGGAVTSVFGRTGAVVAQSGDYSKAQVGLGNVDNTSDANKPISTATATALAGKATPADIATAISAHVAAADPHPVYLTSAEGNTAYSPLGHMHPSTDVTDFAEAVEDLVASALQAGTGISLTYDDPSGQLTISATGGGGGGATPTVITGIRSSGNITGTNVGSVWEIMSGFTVSTPAVAGDHVEIQFNGLLDHNSGRTDLFDIAVVVAGAGVRYASSNGAAPSEPDGLPEQSNSGSQFATMVLNFWFTVEAGDLEGGNVTFAFAHKGPGTGSIQANINYPLRWRLRNDHQ